MATALYRRYRPEAFSEMIGQAHVTEPLMTALRTGRIGHAYLFSGPRGCGKTSSARILARCLNCAEGPTDAPCGTCQSCIELSRDGGGSLDVVEIDAASHGGVDDARDLRERAVFAPARDRYKIFIIDEAHMVTAGGFNALLKIVEEPPPHVKFIFATTEPEKVIGTIRSRTHHYPFRLIAPGALIDYAQQLCDSEGVGVEPGVLPLVVRAGGGSVRDTLSILDQLIAGSDDAGISLERATGLLGFTSAEMLDEVVVALGSGDSAAAFAATDRVVQTGQDPRRFVEDLLERLRDLIVISATTVQGGSSVFRGVPDDQLQRMFEQSQLFTPGQLSQIADTVSATLDGMTGATPPRLHLELMVARAIVAGAGASRAHARDDTVAASQPRPSSSESTAAQSRTPSAPRARSASVPLASASQASAPAASDSSTPGPAPTVQAPGPGEPAPTSATASAAPGTTASGAPQSVVPKAPQGAAADPSPSRSAVDVVSALKSARDFLNSDNAGAERPPIVPLGGHPPQQKASVSDGAPSNDAQPDEARPDAAASGLARASASDATPVVRDESPELSAAGGVSIDDVWGAWSEILEELLESDREAWNAVRSSRPLGLDGELLSIGFVSRSDLEIFKASGAGPLREAIEAALGVTVKYVPKSVPMTAAASESDAAVSGVAMSNSAPSGAASVDGAASGTAVQSAPPPGAEVSSAEPQLQPEAPPRAQTATHPASPHRAHSLREDEYSEPPAPAWAEPISDSEEAAEEYAQHSDGVRPGSAERAPEDPPGSNSKAAEASGAPVGSDLHVETDVSVGPDVREGSDTTASSASPVGTDVSEGSGSPVGSEAPAEPESAVGSETPTGSESTPEPQSPEEPESSAGLEAAAASEPVTALAPAPETRSEPRVAVDAAPPINRYGESVVREVLGARFVEERPLPQEES